MENLYNGWLADPTIARLVVLALGLVMLFVAIRLLRLYLARHIKTPDMRYRARKATTFAGYLLVFVFVTTLFSGSLRQLTLAFGVAGAGIAFALQEVIASVAGWIAVAFGGFYNIGDRVQLGGIKGDVIDIGVLRTTIMEVGEWVKGDLYSGRIVRVANSFVFKEPVFNYSGDFPFVWDEITVPVRHGGDHRRAKELLQNCVEEVVGDYVRGAAGAWEEMVRKYRIEDARIEPLVTLVANDNWLEFTIRYIVDYRQRRSVKDQLFARILEMVELSGGAVKLASATFEVVGVPALDLRLSRPHGEPT